MRRYEVFYTKQGFCNIPAMSRCLLYSIEDSKDYWVEELKCGEHSVARLSTAEVIGLIIQNILIKVYEERTP